MLAAVAQTSTAHPNSQRNACSGGRISSRGAMRATLLDSSPFFLHPSPFTLSRSASSRSISTTIFGRARFFARAKWVHDAFTPKAPDTVAQGRAAHPAEAAGMRPYPNGVYSRVPLTRRRGGARFDHLRENTLENADCRLRKCGSAEESLDVSSPHSPWHRSPECRSYSLVLSYASPRDTVTTRTSHTFVCVGPVISSPPTCSNSG